MASILCLRFQFYVNNPAGTFVAGDIVDVYYDPALDSSPTPYGATGVSVKKNDVIITSGPSINANSQSGYGLTKFNPLICNGTIQVKAYPNTGTFPYLGKDLYPDSPSCAVTVPVVCDIAFSGVPLITNASDATTADGQIQITAISTRSIQYKLNGDFVYGDGTSNTTGIFTLLLPGDYRIYARDSVNCSTNIVVNVGITETALTFGEYYRLEYDDLAGDQTNISIFKKGFSGSITEVKGADDPFTLSLRGEGENNKFIPVLGTEGVLRLTSETESQFSSLYTNNPLEFKMEYYKDFGDGYTLIWTGYVLPQQYEEDYKSAPYYIQVNATDGLANLDKKAFVQDDGQLFFGNIKQIKLVSFLLKATSILLPIRVGINLYATAMTSLATDDPLDQAYVDFDAFYISEKTPTYLYALEELLKPYGARLVQFNGAWNIIRIEEMVDSYDYREFDKDGDYVSNGTENPVLDVTPPDDAQELNFSDSNQHLELRPGYGLVRLQYRLGLTDNILRNGDFRLKSAYNSTTQKYELSIDTFGFQLVRNSGEVVTENYESLQSGNVAYLISGDRYSTNNGESYLQSAAYNFRMGSTNTLKITLKYKVPTMFTPLGQVMNLPYQKIRFQVKYGTRYLKNDGSWTTTANIISIYAQKFNEYVETEITAQQPSASYATTAQDLIVTVYKSYYQHYEYSSTANLKAAPIIVTQTYATFAALPTIGEAGITYLVTAGSLTYSWNGTGYTNITGGLRPGPDDGTRTQAYDGTYVNWYELRSITSAESIPTIVRPNDYNSTTNPRQWVKVFQTYPAVEFNRTPFWIDKVQIQFLDNGEDPIDTIIHDRTAEPLNTEILPVDLIFGSYSEVVKTGTTYVVPNGLFLGSGVFSFGQLPQGDPKYFSIGNPVEIVQSILSAKLIYRGYLRDSTGVGFETWKRDGVSESTSLHSILGSVISSQYVRPYRKLTGSIYGSSFFGFINVFRETFDNNRFYLPMSMSISDFSRRYNGEFLELINTTVDGGDPGSDGSSGSPFTSGFSTGFGAGN